MSNRNLEQKSPNQEKDNSIFPDIKKIFDEIHKGINRGVNTVGGRARWVARDWHWAGIVPPIGLLAGVSQAENISQAAIQTWEQIHPSTPVVKTIDNPQADSIVVPIASPMVEPTALPTPQAPEPEVKGGIGPNPPDKEPDKEPGVKDDIKPKADDVKQTEEPKDPKIEPPQKPLPEVMTDQTVKYNSPSAREAHALTNQAEQKGEFKIPMPAIIQKNKLEEVPGKGKATALAITPITEITEKVQFDIPALTAGKVIEVYSGPSTSIIGIQTESGKIYGFIFPSSSEIQVKKGDVIEVDNIGQSLASVTYDPNNPETQKFIKSNQREYPKAPSNALFFIGGASGTPGLKKPNILTTDSVEDEKQVVIVGKITP